MEGVHCASKHRVFVKQRQDSISLTSSIEQVPQICQVRGAAFGADVNETSCQQLHDEAWEVQVPKPRGQLQSQNVGRTSSCNLGHLARQMGCRQWYASESVLSRQRTLPVAQRVVSFETENILLIVHVVGRQDHWQTGIRRPRS